MLSCENIKDCENSLIQILSISIEKLHEIKKEIRNCHQDAISLKIKSILSKYDLDTKKSIPVCFYHFTKTLNPDLFSSGLKSLPHVMDSIVDEISSLYGVHSKSEIMAILYDRILLASRLRLSNYNAGPYGFFIKEHGFIDDTCSHQYLNGSEFVADLLVALGYDERLYLSASKSLIIKFKVDNLTIDKLMYYVSEALMYITFGDDLEKLKLMCSSHDNFGLQINPRDILKIEVL